MTAWFCARRTPVLKDRLISRWGMLSHEAMAEVEDRLRICSIFEFRNTPMNRAFSPESFRGCPRLEDECCAFGAKQTGVCNAVTGLP